MRWTSSLHDQAGGALCRPSSENPATCRDCGVTIDPDRQLELEPCSQVASGALDLVLTVALIAAAAVALRLIWP